MPFPTEIFSATSLKSLARVTKPIYLRSPVTYQKDWLAAYIPNQSYYLSEKRRKTLQKEGKPQHANEPAGTYARQIYNRLLIDLSYHSSRLEGNTYSLLETQRLLLEGVSAIGKLDTERMMILNHQDAIRHLVDTAHRLKIDTTEIYTLHYLLSDGLVPSQYAGKIRDHGVRIGGSTYIPLENKIQIEAQLQSICQTAATIDDCYEQSFFLLVHLAYLQAFTDVNKRTARLSANIPLIKGNLVPLSFNHIAQDDYIACQLCVYEHNDVKPLVDLYYFSYLRTCQEYRVVSEAIGFDEIRVHYRMQRRELLREIIMRQLTGKKLKNYLAKKIPLLVPEAVVAHFQQNVYEDLNEMSPARIAGLGVTVEEMQAWQQKFK